MKVLERRGWNLDEVCLSFIGSEGGKAHVARQKKIVKDIVGKHGGIRIGKGPGVLYDQKKYDTGLDPRLPSRSRRHRRRPRYRGGVKTGAAPGMPPGWSKTSPRLALT